MMAAGRSGVSVASGVERHGGGIISDGPGTVGRLAPDRDDRSIVQAVLDGDRDAFRRLVERESAGVVRVCDRILADHAEAEDVAQEAFVTAYRSLATWRGDGPFGAWLGRGSPSASPCARPAGAGTVAVARPRAARRVRRQRDGSRRPRRRSRRDRRRAAHGPGDPHVRAERATEVRDAVLALPEPYREVVALRFFADATLDEIARQTGRPLGTVKTHLHRGLARLRTALGEGTER